jgi:hypothetical protein
MVLSDGYSQLACCILSGAITHMATVNASLTFLHAKNKLKPFYFCLWYDTRPFFNTKPFDPNDDHKRK